MSRTAVVSILIVYLVAALGFGVFMEMQAPFPVLNAATLFSILGRALGAYVVSGVFPIIVWAFFRFRLRSAAGPLVSWGFIGALFCYTSYVGYRFDKEQQIASLVSTSTLSGKDRDDFVRNATRTCSERQRKNALNIQSGITGQQIDIYCKCFAETAASVITPAEIASMAEKSIPSASLQEKIDQAAARCGTVVRR
jgi:hypothetical protein